MKYSPYESFKHGLTVSKIWLVENREKHLPKSANVAILGGWSNILSYIMLVRNHQLYDSITSFDIDPDAKTVADEICDTWKFEKPTVTNITQDVNLVDLSSFNVVINTSLEHMTNNNWFANIKSGTVVCLQATNLSYKEEPWLILNPIKSIEILKQKFPLTEIHFSGTKEISYTGWGYKRFMIIGIK